VKSSKSEDNLKMKFKISHIINKKMFDVILAMTKDNGIGFEGKLPWSIREELAIFKKKTMNKLLIIGRKTAESLPQLKNRRIIVLSRNESKEEVIKDIECEVSSVFTCLTDALTVYNNDGKIFIAGGAELYNQVFSNWRHYINEVHLSVIDGEYECDTFVSFSPSEWTVKSKLDYDGFTHYVLSPDQSEESKYLSLLGDVYVNGWVKKGRNGNTKSMFGKTIEFDLTNSFPLLTTKKMFTRGVIEELLFFIRGNSDSTILENKKINIWKGNTSRQFLDSIGKTDRRKGVMGPMYGYQWRNYNAPYDEEKAGPKERGFDQLQMVVDQIRNDPHSRRILLTDFNPLQAHEGVLHACHSIIIQFYVSEGFLDIYCFNRSSDLFHGLPFNIASTALFQTLIAKITGLVARKFVLGLGDSHIYESHYDVVEKQLRRIPYKFPKLDIIKDVKTLDDVEKLEVNDFKFTDYDYHPTLKADMVA
jgi:dihydrofolate reductase / thymidylate synthase